MRVLTFTNLYPNSFQPRHGIFVEHRLRQLAASGEAVVRVVAPVPWVPLDDPAFRQFAVLARVPKKDERHGITIRHPRFPAIPRITGWINPFSMAVSALPAINQLRRESGDFDLIDAHFFYPDGAAAVLLGRWFGKPVVVTARGTDINEFPGYRVPRAWILWVARQANALITVSAALREALRNLGVPPERITVLRNGVDFETFRSADRAAMRQKLGLSPSRPTLLSVGHLVENKGHHFVIEALRELSAVDLVIVGDGPMRAELAALAERCGVADRITWTGTLLQPQIAEYYAAATATVLASRSEGMPNVLLESLACGTPVIATAVGGIAEVVCAPEAGVLMHTRSAEAIVDAWRQLTRAPPSAEAVHQHAEQFSWGPTTQGLLQLFRSIIDGPPARAQAADGRA